MNTKARKLNGARGAIDSIFPSAPKLLVIAVALACSSAYGATKTWDAGTGTWSNSDTNWANCWLCSDRPQTGDDVVIDPSGSSAKTVTYAGGSYTGNSLTINSLTFSNASTADILDLTGGTLSVTNKFWAKTNSIVKIRNSSGSAALYLNGTGANASDISNLQISSGGILGGTGKVTVNGSATNGGNINVGTGGNFTFMQGVTGTTGTLQTTGGTLDLRTNNSTAGTVNIGTGGALLLNNKSLTVSTDYTNSFGTGNSFTRTAGVTSGGASGVINAADIAGGATGANTFQQLSVNGGTTTATNTTLALGNIHVGNSISGTYNIYNKEAAGGVTLRGAITGTGIDSRLSGTGVDVTTSSWTAAANGNTGNKTVTLNGTTAGAVNSTVNIVNNFANTNSQALTITGGVYQYAQPTLSQSSVIFANRHVGDAASQVVSITNTNSGAPAGFQELLNASWSGSGATGSGSFSSLGVGSSSNITVGLNTIAAGNLSGFVTITPVSNGTGTSGLGNTTLGTQMVSVSGKVYQYAQPTFTGSSPVNFGIVHVGDTVSQAVGIANTSHAQAGYQEKLNASFSAATTGITTAGSTSLVQGASSNALSVGIDTATAGSRSGTATVALVSDGAGTSGLGTTNLASQNVSVLGQVNNYAAVGLTQAGGAGAFSGSGTNYVFNLGTITLNTGSAAGSLSLANTGGSAAFTDYLSGAFNVAGVTNFTLTGFSNITALAGGSSLGLGVALNNNALGSFDQFVTLTPTGYNASGYSGGLSEIRLELKGNVVAAVPEPASYAMFIAGLGLMAGIARRRRQQG